MLSQKLLQHISSVEALQVGAALGGAPQTAGIPRIVNLPHCRFQYG